MLEIRRVHVKRHPPGLGQEVMLLDHPFRDQFVADRHGIRNVQRTVAVDVSNFCLVKTVFRAAKTVGTSLHPRPTQNCIRNLLEQFAHKN